MLPPQMKIAGPTPLAGAKILSMPKPSAGGRAAATGAVQAQRAALPPAGRPAPAAAPTPGTAAHATQWAKTPGLAPQASSPAAAPAKPSLASRAADAAAPVVRGAGAGIEAAGNALGAAGEKVKDVVGKAVEKGKEVAGKVVEKGKEVASKATAPAAPTGELTGAGKADSILNSIKLRHLPAAGAAAGMALGAIAPGTDEDGKKKSRIEGALMGGLSGGALGGLGMLPFASGRRLYNTYAAPHMQMRAPAAAPAAARRSLGGNVKNLAPGKVEAQPVASPKPSPDAPQKGLDIDPLDPRNLSFA